MGIKVVMIFGLGNRGDEMNVYVANIETGLMDCWTRVIEGRAYRDRDLAIERESFYLRRLFPGIDIKVVCDSDDYVLIYPTKRFDDYHVLISCRELED